MYKSPSFGIFEEAFLPLTLFLQKPKKGDKNVNKWTSSPSLNTASGAKLDPLPGSPIHEELLNRARPLPPPQMPHKKFVK